MDADFLVRDKLLARMEEMRDVLVELNGRVVRADREIAETFDRAWKMMKMRHMLIETGEGFTVVSRNRPLISYYANSIAHLLGPFAAGVQARDTLPAMAITGNYPGSGSGPGPVIGSHRSGV
jgi:hypothetical protein